MPPLLIHSHRGLDFGPENSLSAFHGALAAGRLYSTANLASLKEKGLKVYAISPDVAYQSHHPLAHDHKYVPVWENLINWGVDGICTDQSQELLGFLDK